MKKWPYITVMAALAVIYTLGQIYIGWEPLTNTVSTVLAIIAAVSFWLELKHNDMLNEGKFIIELNNQFITNPQLSEVEWTLEKYYAAFLDAKKKGDRTEEIPYEMDINLDNPKRQYLVNYLVHLEGIATLVNDGVLGLDAISDLMAYRYFIAVNNRVVQDAELFPYSPFYQECYKLYETWNKKLGYDVPMSENNLLERHTEYMYKQKNISDQRNVHA